MLSRSEVAEQLRLDPQKRIICPDCGRPQLNCECPIPPPSQANQLQVGGEHYRKTEGEQHWDRLVRLYGLPRARCYFIGNITSYVERYQDKNGIEDLKKAQHYITKLIELETAEKEKTSGSN